MPLIVDALKSENYALAPDLLLKKEGAKSGQILYVVNGEIAFAGERTTFDQLYPGIAITELPCRAIVPGFIDAHTHLGQAFGKSLTGGEPAQIWRRVWVPLESSLNAEMAYVSAKWMFLEALRGGFTTITNFAILSSEKAHAVHRAAEEVGIRLVSCTGAVQVTDLPEQLSTTEMAKLVDGALLRAEQHLEACAASPLITPSLCVSGVQGASGELMRSLSEFSAQNGALFQIHTNEHHVEVHWSVVRYGKRPLELFAEHGAVGRHTLHHHCTFVTDDEIELLRDTESAVSYNPMASIWKGDRVAPALALAARGVRFGLGTDSTRSDALRLLEAAETCQRIAQGMSLADFSCGSAMTWIDAATRGSADASGLGDTAGSLESGYRADFLILDRSRPEVLPSWDFEWELVRPYNRDQIDAVVIDGKLVMAGGQPAHWSADEFVAEHLEDATSAVKAAPIERKHGISTSKWKSKHAE